MNLKKKFLSTALAAVCGVNVCMTATGFLSASATEKVPGYTNVDNYISDSIINGYVSLETGESTEAYGLYNPDSTSQYTYEKISDAIISEEGLVVFDDYKLLKPELFNEASAVQIYEQIIINNIDYIENQSTCANKINKFMLSLLTELTDSGLASSEKAVLSMLESTSKSDNTKTLAALKELGYESSLSEYKNIINLLDTDNAYDYYTYLSIGLALEEICHSKVEVLTEMKDIADEDKDFCVAADNAITAITDSYVNASIENDVILVVDIKDGWEALDSSNIDMYSLFDADEAAAKIYMLMQNNVSQYYDDAVFNFYTDYNKRATQENAENFHSTYENNMLFQQKASENAAIYAASILTDTDISGLERDNKNCGIQVTIIDQWYENYLDYTDTESIEIDFTQDVVEYNGHYYKVFNNSISWIYAKEYCELMGGHLATVTDEEEQLVVEGVAQACTDAENFWIGGYLSKITDEWTWVDDTPFEYTNWDANQPDFHQGEEYYIRFTNDDIHYENWTAAMGKWNDCANEASGDDNEGDAVSIQTFAFICEWDSDDFQLDYIVGDANNDGKVNVRDAAYIASALAKNETSALTISADFNEDGKINVRDAAAIAKYLASKK